MRKLLLLLVLTICGQAFGGVVADGRAATYENALTQAKLHALELQAGTFVIHSSKTTESSHTENTDQYTGGVVTSYKVLSSVDYGDGTFGVKIDATIKEGKNNVVSSTHLDGRFKSDLKAITDNIAAQEAFVPAFGKYPTFEIDRGVVLAAATAANVAVKIGYKVEWTPKLVSDLSEYLKLAGMRVEPPSESTAHSLAAIVSAVAPQLASTAFSIASKLETPKDQSTYVVCTTHSATDARRFDKCASVATRIPIIEQTYILYAKMKFDNGTTPYVLESVLNLDNLRAVTPKGMIIYTRGREESYVVFQLSRGDAQHIADVEFSILPHKPAVIKRSP